MALTLPTAVSVNQIDTSTRYNADIDYLLRAGHRRLSSFPTPTDTGEIFWHTGYTPNRLYMWNGTVWVPLISTIGSRVVRSTNYTLINNSVAALTFDAERTDTDAIHSTSVNTDRLTAPVAGVYLIGGSTRYATNAVGVRTTYIEQNGSVIIGLDTKAGISGTLTDISLNTLYYLNAGDYVRLMIFQTSGGNLDVQNVGNFSPEFWMYRIGG